MPSLSRQVIAPVTLLEQWRRELRTWATEAELQVHLYSGGQAEEPVRLRSPGLSTKNRWKEEGLPINLALVERPRIGTPAGSFQELRWTKSHNGYCRSASKNYLRNGPNTVLESTVSNTELSEFF